MPTAVRTAIAQLLMSATEAKVFPGAAWATGDSDGIHEEGACGVLDPAAPMEQMRTSTVFDLASLTKIISTWASIGTLWQAGELDLTATLGHYLPDVRGFPLAGVSVHQLLTHTAGLPRRANLRRLYGMEPRSIKLGVLQERLSRRPGEAVEYTDRSALILGFLIARLTGRPLRELSHSRVWVPLGMTSTSFSPMPANLAARCAPTEWDGDSGRHLRGTPHDFSARLLGGSCGSAGTFSTVGDLGSFLRFVVAPEEWSGARPGFGRLWIEMSLRVRTGNLTPQRGLYWHPVGSGLDDVWAHSGFTGTAMWVSPSRNRWAVLLTNKVYFSRDSDRIGSIRAAFIKLAFDKRTS